MTPENVAKFIKLTNRFEGKVPHFYLDIKGLVTIGFGCLIEPESACYALSMVHPDGTIATTKDVVMDWRRIKLAPRLAIRGWRYAGRVAKLRMTEENIQQLLRDRLGGVEQSLALQFPLYGTFPDDLKLACCLIAWAVGSNLKKAFPKFSTALLLDDMKLALAECQLNETYNPGVVPRNLAIKKLIGRLVHS
jgi:hypothetical protein